MEHDLVRAAVARQGLLAFIRHFWHHAGEAVEFVEEPHLHLLCRHLEACALNGTVSLKPDVSKMRWAVCKDSPSWVEAPGGKLELTPGCPDKIADLVIAVPPGCTKSKLCSVFWPAWIWTWAPGAKFICTSYADDLAIDFGRQAFDVMRSEDYRKCWPHLEIEEGDRAAMSDYRNTRGGRRWSLPLGGKPTGKHAHFLLADDPTKPDDLKLGGDSAKAALEQVRYRWDAIFSSRSAHPASFTRVVIAQRLHQEDLSGHFVNQGAVHLKLPMEFEPHVAYSSPWGSDWRTVPGELLLPKRFTEEVVAFRRKIMPARDYAAQMQQRPAPEDGAMFQRSWFSQTYVGQPWGQAPVVLSVDASNKETKGSDFFVCQAWSKVGGQYYLVDQIRKRAGFPAQVEAIAVMRSKWANVRQILVEPKANGNAIIQQLKTKFPGIVEVDPQGGKESRAAGVSWLWSTNSVWLPKNAPWLDEFIDEHLTFPVGAHDDSVDAASQLLGWWSKTDKAALFARAMDIQRKAGVQRSYVLDAGTHRVRGWRP